MSGHVCGFKEACLSCDRCTLDSIRLILGGQELAGAERTLEAIRFLVTAGGGS